MHATQLKRLLTAAVAIVPFLSIVVVSEGYLAAQCGVSCPPYTPPPGPNLLKNPDFDAVGPCGSMTWWSMGNGNCPADPIASAAQDWKIHSSNSGDMVRTYL